MTGFLPGMIDRQDVIIRVTLRSVAHGGNLGAIAPQRTLMRLLITVSFLVVAVIHLLPLPGVLGNSQLATLYGVEISDPNLAILLRHRAVLFGLLGTGCAIAAFVPSWQNAMLIAAGISTVSFLLLAVTTGGYNTALTRVVTADIVAIVCLALAAVLRVLAARGR